MSEGKIPGNIKKLLDFAPKSSDDYFRILFWRVSRKLALFIIACVFALCGGALLFMRASGIFAADGLVFPYDSVFLSFYNGQAGIRAKDGHLAYRGEIKDGAVNGEGTLWNTDGGVVYEGGFENNLYSGQGVLYGSGGRKKYEGGFQEGVYSGEGTLCGEGGSPVYTGNFRNGSIIYEELAGADTAQIAERYSGRQMIYLWQEEICVVMDDIHAVYRAVNSADSLEEGWTAEGIYVLESAFPAGVTDADEAGLLEEYFGEPLYSGSTHPVLGDAVAWAARSREPGKEEESPQIEAAEVYEDTFEVSGWDEEFRFWITAYEKDGFLYTFYSDLKERGNGGFWFYLIEPAKETSEKETDGAAAFAAPVIAMQPCTAAGTKEAPMLTLERAQKLALDSLEHEQPNLKYKIQEETAGLFADVYEGQEKTKFLAENIARLEDSCGRGEWKVRTGEMTEKELAAKEQELAALETEYSGEVRNLEAAREKLSEQINLELTEEYALEAPSADVSLDSQALPVLLESAVENNQEYYEAKMNQWIALLALETNESLMESQYGSKMEVIRPYIIQAKNGEKINSTEFKEAYDSFLESIEEPGEEGIHILFIKISKERLKISLDGVSSIEDDPYVLYANALEYADMCRQTEGAEKELRENVSAGLDNVLSLQENWSRLEEAASVQERSVSKSRILCRTGDMSYEEFGDEEETLAILETDKAETLAEIVRRTAALERLTGGGVSAYISGEKAGKGGK